MKRFLPLIPLTIMGLFALINLITAFIYPNNELAWFMCLSSCVGIILSLLLIDNPQGWIVVIFGFSITLIALDLILPRPLPMLGAYALLVTTTRYCLLPLSALGTITLAIHKTLTTNNKTTPKN